ncbi:MAG: sigma-70 family RNA polymerase sigma factor [Myxococcales bacterium]|nr:sigma-70 family RNA polymerase sigma factor [Myxococcales bacterium]
MSPRSANTTPTLADVYRAHAGFVWRVVRRFGVPEEAAEDVMHEVFLVVRRRLPEYDGRAALRSWLFGIARGVAANSRRARLRAERRIERLPAREPARTPEDVVRRREAAEFVRAFLERLDPEMRLVFELVDIEGMRATEVAALLESPRARVYSRLRLARARFTEALARRDAPRQPPGAVL